MDFGRSDMWSERIPVLRDLKAKLGELPLQGVIEIWKVPGIIGNGERLVQVYVARKLVNETPYLKKKETPRNKIVNEIIEGESLVDYVVIKYKENYI